MSEASSADRLITLTEPCDFPLLEGLDNGSAVRRYGLLLFCEAEAQLHPLDDGSSVVIGRKPPSELLVDDLSVSRQHARVARRKNEVWVEDLDSRNGIFRRGQKIYRERLEVGDEVVVGRARLVLAGTRLPEVLPAEPVAAGDSGFVLLNARMKRVYEEAVRAASVDVPVLVLGETGVGKEHFARAIHSESTRRSRPFVVVNCAAIPASLLESTLFGHERGAFKGAATRAVGLFERANGGVLFLDEIGDLGSGAQVALLRAIETRRISRVGSSQEIPIDVRIVTATHCDLEAMVEDGTFRQDLYYRLNGIALEIPPLRERQDEILPLVHQFLLRAHREWAVLLREMTPEAMERLRQCSWPGNVRQLRHAVERAALLAANETIGVADLPDFVGGRTRRIAPTIGSEPPIAIATESPIVEFALKEQVRRHERAVIGAALRHAGGNRRAAAKLLRIPLRTLFRKIRALSILDEEVGGASESVP